MRNSLLYAALTLGLYSCTTLPESPQETLLQSRHAALVETVSGRMGTGFPITEDSWLTAWHVVEGVSAESITVDGWAVLEVSHLEGIDAAVLVTHFHGQRPWPLADRETRAGERVWKSGYGQGIHWWTEGIATEDRERIALDIFPGDSGGPVFDSKGRVLGIVVAVGITRGYYQDLILHHCWIVPSPDVLDALPEGFFDEARLPVPVDPLPVPETAWERFLRLKRERGF